MKKFNEALFKFIKDKDFQKFMTVINGLESIELLAINNKIEYQNELLSPLSIIIRQADTFANAPQVVEMLINLGAKVNIDYGYHGDRHPTRPLPPLIEAIQYSISKQSATTLYTDIVKILLKNGADVNKIGDNISPLFACYNPTGDLSEERSYNPVEINDFKNRRRNKEIFDNILNHESLDTESFDIMKNLYIPWRDQIHSYGGQLIDFLDRELKKFPEDDIQTNFFIPLFNKMLNNRLKDAKYLTQTYSNNLNQNEIDHAMRNGLMFSAIARRDSSDVFSLSNRLIHNSERFIDDVVSNIKSSGVTEVRCLSGMYGLPAIYFGSVNKVHLEGLCYHGNYIRPLLFSKSDIWSYPREIKYNDLSFKSFAFEDLHYKVTNYSFKKMLENREIAELRRSGKIKETSNREENNKTEFTHQTKKANYTLFFNPITRTHLQLEGKRPKGILHNECLSNLYKPSAILSVCFLQDTLGSEFSTPDHDWLDGIHENFINLRDLQRQKHYLYLTGDLLPIVRTNSKDNYPKIIDVDEVNSLKKLFDSLNSYPIKREEFCNLLVEQKFRVYDKIILEDLSLFFQEMNIRKVNNPELLLLWSLSMGFTETTLLLLEQNIPLNIKLAEKLGILNDVLIKGHMEEASFLLKTSLQPEPLDIIHETLLKFGWKAFNINSRLSEHTAAAYYQAGL